MAGFGDVVFFGEGLNELSTSVLSGRGDDYGRRRPEARVVVEVLWREQRSALSVQLGHQHGPLSSLPHTRLLAPRIAKLHTKALAMLELSIPAHSCLPTSPSSSSTISGRSSSTDLAPSRRMPVAISFARTAAEKDNDDEGSGQAAGGVSPSCTAEQGERKRERRRTDCLSP